MLFRLGQVVWWLGSGVFVLAAMSVMGSIMDIYLRGRIGDGIAGAVVMALFAVCCWAVAFVLTGSFWKSPRRPASK